MQQNQRGQGRRTFDARVVKQEVRGSWLDVLVALAPGLEPAINKVGKHVPCPVHGGKDGFRLFPDAADTGGGSCNTCGRFADGLALLQWYNEWNFPQTVEAVGIQLGLDSEQQNLPQTNRSAARSSIDSEKERKKREYKDGKNRDELKRVWSEGYPISAPEAEPARLYLARRGLKLKYALSFPFLKFHPSMGYFHENEILGNFPCLIALVYDANGRPVTIHRTFLTEEGFKAPVPTVKKLMPYPSDRKMTGGGIPLMDIQQFVGNCEHKGRRITAMGVTEGIETALAVIEASEGKMPVWPLISSTLLEKFQVPEMIDMVCIYGDQDLNDAGREAAINLKERLTGENKEVRGFIPSREKIPEDGKSVDWLDILNLEGSDGIPFPKGMDILTN